MTTASALLSQAPVQDMTDSNRSTSRRRQDVLTRTIQEMPNQNQGESCRYNLDSEQNMLMTAKISADRNQRNTETEQDKGDFNPRLSEPFEAAER